MRNRRLTECQAEETAFSRIMVEKYKQQLCKGTTRLRKLLDMVSTILQRFIIHVLSAGPIPAHIAFMSSWMETEGVKYVTVYAFSIDNFKRPTSEVNLLMNLMKDMIENLLRDESIFAQYGVRIYFIGNLKLVDESVRVAAEKAMRITANNINATLMVCVAYTSTDEILRAVEESCRRPSSSKGCEYRVQTLEIEKHLYMSEVPDPDLLIRSSGVSRLSNFMLWQTDNTFLHSPRTLWPDMGFKDLCWSIIKFQRSYSYKQA
ncbi:hypothetical protein QQ045_027675 [Rhodiola kirilowii]